MSYFDRDGQPISFDQWVDLRTQEDRRVAQTVVGKCRVSTVWVGFNMGLSGEKLIFETMVFGGPLNEQIAWYSTLEEALAGHDKMVLLVQESEEVVL